MKLFTSAAIAVLMSSGVAFAQDNTATGNTKNGSGSDPGNYLTGPKIQRFYTDESRKTVRPPAEFKKVWNELNDADRADIKRACSANRDVSYNPLCTNVGAM